MSDLAIGTSLRRFRFESDEMTQAVLAERVGVTRQTIVALETGRYAPSLELAMKLAAVFGCSVDELFYWKDPQQAASRFRFKRQDR